MKRKFIVILVFLFLMILISGCINILPTLENDSIAPGKGRLEIYLTDSSEKYKVNDSEAYSAVYITISKIQVHLAGEDEETEGEWIEWELKENGGKTFDLIVLKEEGLSALLSEIELEPGNYTQIRLFITKANVWIEIANEESEEKIVSDFDKEKDIIVESSESYEEHKLEIPSAYQTGLKLIHPFEIIEGKTTELTIDFDAEESIIKTGNGNYKLQPVIKVITGSIDGNGEEN